MLVISGRSLASFRSPGRDLVFHGIPGAKKKNHLLPQTLMSTVLIKAPSCGKEISYLKLMSKANYCSRFGQGQSVPEQAAGKHAPPSDLATEPVSPAPFGV